MDITPFIKDEKKKKNLNLIHSEKKWHPSQHNSPSGPFEYSRIIIKQQHKGLIIIFFRQRIKHLSLRAFTSASFLNKNQLHNNILRSRVKISHCFIKLFTPIIKYQQALLNPRRNVYHQTILYIPHHSAPQNKNGTQDKHHSQGEQDNKSI